VYCRKMAFAAEVSFPEERREEADADDDVEGSRGVSKPDERDQEDGGEEAAEKGDAGGAGVDLLDEDAVRTKQHGSQEDREPPRRQRAKRQRG